MTDWLPGAERDEQGGGVTLNRSLPPRAVWHITWDALAEDGSQPDFDAVANYLKRMAYCPHLMWDPWTGKIVQFYPASVGGRALNAWNEDGSACVQIEVFFSPGAVRDGKRYDTVAETPCVGLDKILDWLDDFGIPRVWPMGAPQWQGNSRDADVWNTRAGHYGHCNVPDNTHTDPGPMPSLAITNAGGEVRPIPEEDDMPYRDWPQADKDAFLKDMYEAVWFGRPGAKLVQNRRLGRGEWPETIIGSGEQRIQRELLPPALAGVKATVDPKVLAASIPKEMAAQVAAELGKRITNG